MTNLEQKIEELVEPYIKELGLELYDVEFVKEGKNFYLRIFIDNPENDKGVSIDDCEKVTNVINDVLDSSDYIKESYILEVSSSGIEKVLKTDKHLEQNIGKKVEISLYIKFENKKQYVGELERFNDNEIVILTDDEEISFERKNISSVKTLYNWN